MGAKMTADCQIHADKIIADEEELSPCRGGRRRHRLAACHGNEKWKAGVSLAALGGMGSSRNHMLGGR